jgi:photosystem II stability/assembly factor-like uncharacterized protein
MFFRIFIFALLCGCAAAEQWMPVGPEGGDARSLAYDPSNPDHVFLGTSTGTIFHSVDAGRHWVRFAHVGAGTSYVVDHIIVDPLDSDHIYAAAWSLESHRAGELFTSSDAGKTWRITPAMHGKSIRALCLAPSDPKVIIIGALDGVFRSKDGGRRWQKISLFSHGIQNVESIAIDPENPEIIYAGTWHLAWKTVNGGISWRHVREGVIDDSDVFSILLDRSNSQTVFASACSGIYRSTDGGNQFQKIENMPFSARRTHVLRQDPTTPTVIYAGTTEGLWVTSDAGETWERATDPDLVVNDISIDPRNSGRVLLATDRAGVLATDGQSLSYSPSNSGFTHRFVSSILADRTTPDRLYVGVVNDREQGGVFVSAGPGNGWDQRSDGLEGRDVFTLAQAEDGSILAGTNRGIFKLLPTDAVWRPLTNDSGPASGNAHATQDRVGNAVSTLKVNAIELTPYGWFAGTSTGLYVSNDRGRSWRRDTSIASAYIVSVKAQGDTVVLATPRRIFVSRNRGKKWALRRLPANVDGIQSLALTSDNQIVIASHAGAFRGPRLGAYWARANGLPHGALSQVIYDEANHRLLIASADNPAVFGSRDGGRSWKNVAVSGYGLRGISVVCGRIVGATLFDGMVVEHTSDSNHPAPTEQCPAQFD